MSVTSEISSLLNSGYTPQQKDASGVLGKDDFLQLLVTQLKNQDPLNPEDPTEFTAQLAQFSSLEQLFNVNERLEQMNSSNIELQRLSALSLLGREVVSESASFRLAEGTTVKLGCQLRNSADEVQINVQDQANRTVATLTANRLQAGEHFFQWDGVDDNGQVAPPGEYSLLVSALRGEDDETVTASPLVRGLVTGVDLDEQGNMLVTNSGDFRLNTVRSVRSM
jgi:flagellar basal-body rod modification protein FlgD